MDQVLARFREEYVIILESNVKALTPQEVYDAVTEVHKAQLRAFHLFGKALEVKLTGHEDRIRKMVREKLDEIIPSQTEIKNQFKHFSDQSPDMISVGLKLDQMHTARYTLSPLVMDEIQKFVQAKLGSSTAVSISSSHQPASTSTNLQI
ncbi:hypothetical protein AgCh_000646 [Apium graveolens]